jgi:NAD-dependent histone deacetylase SIR2
VIGTSLTVHPFASLVGLVPDDCPRVLINLDEVGNFNRQDDIVSLGKCDDIIRELCRELGWEEELERAWAATKDSVEVDDKLTASETKVKLGEELDRITRDIEKSLAISKDTPEPLSDSDTEETEGQKECPENKGVDKKKVEGDPCVLEGKV